MESRTLHYDTKRSTCPNHCGDIATDGTVIMADCCRQTHSIALNPGWTEITSKYRSDAVSRRRGYDQKIEVHCLVTRASTAVGASNIATLEYKFLEDLPADHNRHAALSACLSRHVNEISIKPVLDNRTTWVHVYYFEDPVLTWTGPLARSACVVLKAELEASAAADSIPMGHQAAQEFAREYCRMTGVERGELATLHRDAPAIHPTPGSPTRAYRSRCYGGISTQTRSVSPRPRSYRTAMVRSEKQMPSPVALVNEEHIGGAPDTDRKIDWYEQHGYTHKGVTGHHRSVSGFEEAAKCDNYIVPGINSPRSAPRVPPSVCVNAGAAPVLTFLSDTGPVRGREVGPTRSMVSQLASHLTPVTTLKY